jgi:hypothetical protein
LHVIDFDYIQNRIFHACAVDFPHNTMLRKILIVIYLVLAGWFFAQWRQTPVSIPDVVVRPVLPAVQGPPLSLLRERRYQELDTQLATLQTRYEHDPQTAEQLLIPFPIFYVADPALEPYLDEWVAALPTSYVARVARATYYRKVAHEQRGKRFMADTTPQQVQGMEKYFSLARQDLEASLQLTAKPVLSYVHLLDIGTYLGEAEWNRRLLEDALRVDPHDFIVRRKFIYSLRPKWGAGFAAMAAFLAECQHAGLPTPKLNTLEAVILIEKGYARSAEKDEAGALEYFTQALQAEEGSEENLMAHEWKCAKHAKLQQFALALPDCTVVLAYDATKV